MFAFYRHAGRQISVSTVEHTRFTWDGVEYVAIWSRETFNLGAVQGEYVVPVSELEFPNYGTVPYEPHRIV